ncbi:large ribosomal subunit protein P1-like [Ochotona princeps]|uniref:large ribosomal subunit protein P1-like n=1 Tax=Ochotona princeps TaxID=9978 RepID=UPI00271463AB|nr:large ribosomal subunit protein P1-like [Ochotona princeps]
MASTPSSLISHNEVTIMGDKRNAPGRQLCHVTLFWSGLLGKTLANSNNRRLICKVGAGRPPEAGAAPAGYPVPLVVAAPAEKEAETKNEEPEESDDNRGLWLFD